MKINIRFLRFLQRMMVMPGALSAAAAWAGQPAIPSLDELAGEWPRGGLVRSFVDTVEAPRF